MFKKSAPCVAGRTFFCLAAAVEVTGRPFATKGLASIDHLVDLGTLWGDTTSIGGGKVAPILVEVVAGAFAGETVQAKTSVGTRVLEAEALCGSSHGHHGAEEGEKEKDERVLHYCDNERQTYRRGWLNHGLGFVLVINIL
jgi:hypothetical protein